jgi:hypothetical protein
VDLSQFARSPQLFHYVDGIACVWWAVLLGFALWRRRFNFRWLVIDRVGSPAAYWMVVAAFAGVALWAGLAAIFGWGPGNAVLAGS